MMNVYKISAVTLLIKDMSRSCMFYSKIPGFKLIYGGSPSDLFTSYEIGNSSVYLNLELFKMMTNNQEREARNAVKIILHTEDVDELYFYFKSDKTISRLVLFDNEPTDASWGERYFHIRDPDGYLLSFAKTIKNQKHIDKAL
jgi:catechol 2,3-dioxygenase-like lactoylglutathione lyase family enzyme